MSRGETAVSSFKGVVLIALSVTLLLSFLIWTLPGDKALKQGRSADKMASVGRLNGSKGSIYHRVKKSVDNVEFCQMPSPTKSDIENLRSIVEVNGNSTKFYDNIYRKKFSCLVKRDCSGKTVLSVKCNIKGCSSFTVKNEDSQMPVFNVSPESIEGIIGLQGDSMARIKLICHKGKPHNREKNNWQTLAIKHARDKGCKTAGSRHVHVINIRFLSRWELLARMKRLAKMINSESYKGRVFDFRKYQSLVWRDIDSLSLLFHGRIFTNESNVTESRNSNIIDLAMTNLMNVRVFDLSEEDYQRTLNLKEVLPNDGLECLNTHEDGDIFSRIPSCNCSIFQTSSLEPEEKLAYLTACMEAVDDIDSSNGIMTLTFLENNNWDSSNEDTVDLALTNIIKNSETSRHLPIIILLSDIGNPSFSHFDNSIFLQTQPSNPFLFIFHPFEEDEGELSILAENSNRLISLKDIHVTISDFLSPNTNVDTEATYDEGWNQYDGLSLLRSQTPPRPVLFSQVKSPNIAICESSYVMYPNDTIQVGYAETIVGLINNHVQMKIRDKLGSDSFKCLPFVGEEFGNVRKSYKDDTITTSMDLLIRVASTKEMKLLQGIILKLSKSMKGNETAILEFPSTNFNIIIEMDLVPLACHNELNMDISLIPSAEVPLILRKSRSFGAKPRIMSLHGECLFLVIHRFKDSVAYYVISTCSDREFVFTFGGTLVNVLSIMPLPVKVHLLPGQSYFVTSFVKNSYFVKEYSFHYDTYYEMKFI